MAEDFLNKVSRKASEQLKDLKSPYQSETEGTKAVQLRMSTYRKVRRIALGSDGKIAGILGKATRKDLAKCK